MTTDEALTVLRIMVAAWPPTDARPLTDDATELWIGYLATVDYPTGAEVAGQLVLSEEWMPTISRFREGVNAIRRRDARHELPELTGDLASADVALGHIARLRAVLAGGEGFR